MFGDNFNEAFDGRVLVERRSLRRVVVAAQRGAQAAVRRHGARRTAARARPARPVHARAAPLARHEPEPVQQQRRRATPRYRVTNVRYCATIHPYNSRITRSRIFEITFEH